MRSTRSYCQVVFSTMALLATGCLAPEYSVGGVTIDYCGSPPKSTVHDWSCVDPAKNDPAYLPDTVVTGTFYYLLPNTVVTSFEQCLGDTCTSMEQPNLPQFSFPARQLGYVVVRWKVESSDACASGECSLTMWHTVTRSQSLDVGLVPLLTRSAAASIAAKSGGPLQPGLGAVIAWIKDCNRLDAAGARFVARTNMTHELMGRSFAIHSSSFVPVEDATDYTGWGGLINLAEGAATIYAYVGDGCVVGETGLYVERDRLAYAFLSPNGLDQPR